MGPCPKNRCSNLGWGSVPFVCSVNISYVSTAAIDQSGEKFLRIGIRTEPISVSVYVNKPLMAVSLLTAGPSSSLWTNYSWQKSSSHEKFWRLHCNVIVLEFEKKNRPAYINDLIGSHVVVADGAFHRFKELFSRDLTVSVEIIAPEEILQSPFVVTHRLLHLLNIKEICRPKFLLFFSVADSGFPVIAIFLGIKPIKTRTFWSVGRKV